MKILKVFKNALIMIILFVAGFELGENHHATKTDWEFVLFIAAITLAFIKTAEKTPHFNAGDESGY